jgi:hypothetical protein
VSNQIDGLGHTAKQEDGCAMVTTWKVSDLTSLHLFAGRKHLCLWLTNKERAALIKALQGK